MNTRMWLMGLALGTSAGGVAAFAQVDELDEGVWCTVEESSDANAQLRVHYDHSGRMTALSDASNRWEMQWTYREDGQPLAFVERSAAGERRTVTRYDEAGQAVTAEMFSGDEQVAVTMFAYDDGLLVSEASDTDLDGRADQTRRYATDARGRWVKRETRDGAGDLLSTTERTYDGDSDRPAMETIYAGGAFPAEVRYTYDREGRLLTQRSTQQRGEQASTSEQVTTFDSRGNPLARVLTTDDRVISQQWYTCR